MIECHALPSARADRKLRALSEPEPEPDPEPDGEREALTRRSTSERMQSPDGSKPPGEKDDPAELGRDRGTDRDADEHCKERSENGGAHDPCLRTKSGKVQSWRASQRSMSDRTRCAFASS